MERKKVNIGFDIGITSVGWAIVDEENNIISRGVRTFEEVKDPKDGKLANENRRAKRHLRRTIRRKQNRKLDFIKLISKKYLDIFGIPFNKDISILKNNFLQIITNPELEDVLDLKLKALKTEIKKDELLKILYNYLSHRGYSYLDLEQYAKIQDDINFFKDTPQLEPYINFLKEKIVIGKKQKKDLEIQQESAKYYELFKNEKINDKKMFSKLDSFISKSLHYINEKEKIDKYPSELQKIALEKEYKYRGNTINNEFSIHKWKEEIEKVLNNQSYLTEEFKKDFLFNKNSLFLRLRDFSQGPGSKKSPTPYGLYQKDENNEVIKIGDNLWDKLIGSCSVYPKLLRANKKSFSSEIANLLSQLNTLSIINSQRKSNKLLEEEKIKLFDAFLLNGKSVTLKNIASILNEDSKNIFHYPTDISKKDSNSKDKFEQLDNSKKILSIVQDFYHIKNFSDVIQNIDSLNKIVDVFARSAKDIEKQKIELQKLFEDKDIVEKLIRSNISGQSTASMSEKALNDYIKDEIRDGKGLGQTLNQKYKSVIEKNQADNFKIDASKSKFINFKCLDDEVISPTTKCSFRETIKIFNEILNKYIFTNRNSTKNKFFLKNIVMEMPTEWNSKDKRERIASINKLNEERKKFVKENYGYNGDDKKIIQKLVLLHKQNGRDIYTKERISSDLVIKNPGYCEVDHIIPRSISFDDSMSNKVLVLYKTNQEKGQRTPYEYLGHGKFSSLLPFWKELYLIEGENQDKKKYENLSLQTFDFKKELGFIGRNLSDTRYACRLVNSVFKAWFNSMKENNKAKLLSDDEVNFMTVNGKTTQWYRGNNYLGIKKERDLDFSHHAIDATICAILGNSNLDAGKLIWFQQVDHEKGEVLGVKSKYVSDSRKFYKDETGKNQNVGVSKMENNIKWKQISPNVEQAHIAYSYKMNKKSNFGFYGDSLISVKKLDNDFEEAKVIKFLDLKTFDETKKKMEEIKEKYFSGGKIMYDDPKLLEDLFKAYEEGIKLSTDDQLKKANPFKVYMQHYNDVNGTNIQDRIMLIRGKYKYSVKSLKVFNKINSFTPNKRLDLSKIKNFEKFGAYTKSNWKEIRLFKDDKDKYKVIPMRSNLFKLIDSKRKIYIINEQAYENILQECKINLKNKDKYFVINKGSCMISKDKKEIVKIVGIDFETNRLELKFINKNLEKRIILAINVIMEKYDFIDLDVLGNYWMKQINI